MRITPEEIPQVSQLVGRLCGVVLDSSKDYLIESRLGSVAQDAGCASFAELCRAAGNNQTLQQKIVDAITTNETLFFRDSSPFEALRHKALPELIDSKAGSPFPRRIRIWSAACSTGQEPYSIAMTLCELLPDVHDWDINILATDISDAAITQASFGRYAAYEIQRGMSPAMLRKYFREEPTGWRVNEELRSMVRFDRRNLLKSFADLGVFDVVFCRNVAIYFDEDVKRDLFHRLADRLAPEGYMFVGSSESLAGVDPRFVPQQHCRSVFYQPNKQKTLAMK
jgi:chemotaxis protein methyltransferase CheR